MADYIITESLLSAITSLAGTSSSSSVDTNTVSDLEKWCDDLECQLLTGVQKFTLADGCSTTKKEVVISTASSLKRKAANTLHTSILSVVVPSTNSISSSWNDDDEEANNATLEAVTSFNTAADDYHDDMNLHHLASLLRSTGLYMRWVASSSENNNNNIMTRLKCKGMLLLYAKLLDMDMIVNTEEESTPVTSYPDVPRYASICLFRATYGNDILTTTARTQFVTELDGCSYLMKALIKGNQPVSRLFSVVRNVHHLISAYPQSISKMERALETLTVEQNAGEKTYGLSEVLIATLAWAYRSTDSEVPFPGVAQSDRRSDLVLEILRALYVLGSSNPSNRLPSDDTMTQVGIILCELLQFSSGDERVYQIKLAVVALLLNAPKEYTQYLVNNGGIQQLVDILSYQTSLVVVERTGSSSEDAAAVVPILLVLLKLVQSNESALAIVKNEVFPPDAEEVFQAKATAEIAKGETEGKVNAKNMAPLDAPRGTLRWKLIRLMTWTESNVKRSACELLYALCDNDSTQFVLRTGFGNAIHFLGIRGHVNLPAGVET